MKVVMNHVNQKIKNNKKDVKPLLYMTDSIVYEGKDDKLSYHGGSIEQINSMYPTSIIKAFMDKDIDYTTLITISIRKRKQLESALKDVKMINQLSNNSFKSLNSMEKELYLQLYGYKHNGLYGVFGKGV